MPEITPLQAAINNARRAAADAVPGAVAVDLVVPLVRSWQAFLDHVAQVTPTDPSETEWYEEAYNRGYENARIESVDSLVECITAAVQLLPRVESLEVRADLAEALGHKLEITPEEPDPGRDWSRVEGHLFSATGKWKYRVWLDYSSLRGKPNEPGYGPSGWHFAGAAMAERALEIATLNDRSGVSISKLGTYWHLFVPHPPQGYPIWVRPALAENENQLSFDHFQDVKEQVEYAQAKLDDIRSIAERHAQMQVSTEILEVLDR